MMLLTGDQIYADATAGLTDTSASSSDTLATPVPEYKPPKKNWRVKRGAVPQWYKQRHGMRAKAQSGAARVARFRPPRPPVCRMYFPSASTVLVMVSR